MHLTSMKTYSSTEQLASLHIHSNVIKAGRQCVSLCDKHYKPASSHIHYNRCLFVYLWPSVRQSSIHGRVQRYTNKRVHGLSKLTAGCHRTTESNVDRFFQSQTSACSRYRLTITQTIIHFTNWKFHLDAAGQSAIYSLFVKTVVAKITTMTANMHMSW